MVKRGARVPHDTWAAQRALVQVNTLLGVGLASETVSAAVRGHCGKAAWSVGRHLGNSCFSALMLDDCG